MGLSVNYAWLVAFLLVMVRAIVWLSVVPPFSDRTVIPVPATVGIAAGLACLVAPMVPSGMLPQSAPGFIGAIVVEVLTGLALGFVVNTLLGVFVSAGSLIDLFGGLNLPAAIDPLSLNQTPMVAQFYEQVAVLLLFASDSYLIVVAAFVRSFQLQGFSLALSTRVVDVLAGDLATLFSSALEMAGPIVLVLFATQIVLALLSKAAPQMNVWVMGMPLQIFLSLVLVALNVSVVPAYLGQAVGRATSEIAAMFALN